MLAIRDALAFRQARYARFPEKAETERALDSNEGAPGPLFLQGDHGPIEYRNIVIRPAR